MDSATTLAMYGPESDEKIEWVFFLKIRQDLRTIISWKTINSCPKVLR